MKITALETIRLAEFGNLLWLRVHTRRGLTGLGETFFVPATVEAYVHEASCAEGARPRSAADRPHRQGRDRLSRLSLDRRRDARQLRARHRALGSLRQGDRPADRPAARRLLARADPHLQHLRRHRPTCARAPGRRTANWGLVATAPRTTTTSTASCTGPTSSPLELLSEGITAMKIWPFDLGGRGKPRRRHFAATT